MANDKPNILIFFTDMQRADTIRALGNTVIRTPNLDRLVAEGTAFSDCFSPSPVCVPARCCMHYGLYPQKTGLFDNGTMMPDNGASYPEILGQSGYRTHAVGKCHFTPDRQALRGFQSRRTQEECTSDPQTDDYVAWLVKRGYDNYEPHGARGDMYYIPQISSLPVAAHPSQWIGDESRRFIRRAARVSQPWCLFSSFIHPHPPFAPPKPWHKLYRAAGMPMPTAPKNSEAFHTWINRLQNRYKYRDRGIDLNLLRMMKAYYYASISFVDFQIGRVLDALEASGQLDRTLILFASDHGELLGDFNCFGKRSMHDASVRVPLIARYPARFRAGRTCQTAVSLVDLYSTVLSAAGVDAAARTSDGLDLATVARRGSRTRTVFSQFSQAATGLYMAANTDWKYVHSTGDGCDFLFDRHADPSETVNLAASRKVAVIKEELKQALLRHLKICGRSEAYVERGGCLHWRRYARINEDYLKTPDARLLLQDYPSYAMNLPGYM